MTKTNKTDTTDIRIAIGPNDSLVDFAHKIADQLFASLRNEVTEIDTAAETFVKARFGEDNASFLLILLGHLATNMTEYATYMAAGIYMCAGSKDKEGNHELARGAVKALLRDQKKAAQMGLLAAELQAENVNEQLDASMNMLAELLKSRKGVQH